MRVMTNSGLDSCWSQLVVSLKGFFDPLIEERAAVGFVMHIQVDGFFGESSDSRHFVGSCMYKR